MKEPLKKLTIRLEPRLINILKFRADENHVKYASIINHGIRKALQEIKKTGNTKWDTISIEELV